MKPTIGRIVLVTAMGNRKVFPALITLVNPDDRVTLTVFEESGGHYRMALVQYMDATPGTEAAEGCWTWPPGAPTVADTTGTLPNMIFPPGSVASPEAETIDDLKAQLDYANKQTQWWIKSRSESVQFIADTILARGAGKHEGLVNFVDRIVKERDEAVKSKNGADDLCRAACTAADTAQTENAKLTREIDRLKTALDVKESGLPSLIDRATAQERDELVKECERLNKRITALETRNQAINDLCVRQDDCLRRLRIELATMETKGTK